MTKILIVDDSVDLLEIMKMTLTEEGYEVKTSTNKKEFYSCLKSFIPHVILMDVFLNDVDGREICRALKRTPKTKVTPVIICSANPYAITNYKSCGADDAIEKPFSIPVLTAKIESLVNSTGLKQAS